jgi:hypothetical protein
MRDLDFPTRLRKFLPAKSCRSSYASDAGLV